MADKVRIAFVKSPSYMTNHVAGAWGGLTPQGDIWADFFQEHAAVPEAIQLEVGDGPPTEVEREGGGHHVRELVFGAVFNKEVAFSTARWLLDKATDAGFSGDEEDLAWLEKKVAQLRQRQGSGD